MRSITQTLKVLLCAMPILLLVATSSVYAATATNGCDTTDSTGTTISGVCCDNGTTATSLSKCTQVCPTDDGTPGKTIPQDQDCATVGGNCSDISQCDLIEKYINPFIDFLAALVGVAVVLSIIIGGIQYSSSAGDPSKASAAKDRIRNAIIALVVFIFLYSLLNFLIPGGLL